LITARMIAHANLYRPIRCGKVLVVKCAHRAEVSYFITYQEGAINTESELWL